MDTGARKMAKSLQKIFGQRGGAGGSGLPRGASWGMRLLGTAAVVGFGIYESMYTGEELVRSEEVKE